MHTNPDGYVFLTLKRVSDTDPDSFERTRRALAADRGPFDSYFKRATSDFNVQSFKYDVDPKHIKP